MKLQENSINLMNCNISYYDIRSEIDKTILFVHGNASSKDCFIELIKLLPDYRVIAFDLFGHGSSGKPAKENYTARSFSKLIASIIKKLDLTDITLAGHSLGGHAAIQAIPLIEKRVARVICWGNPPISKFDDFSNAFLPDPSIAPLFKPKSSEDELKMCATSCINNANDHRQFIDDYLKSDPMFRSALFESMATTEYVDEIVILNKCTIPTTLIYSLKDPLINEQYQTEACNMISAQNALVSYKTIDSTHYAQIDNPELLASLFN